MPQRPQLPAAKILICEGKFDKYVIEEICRNHNIVDAFQIREGAGLEKLLPQLSIIIRESGLTHLGIVMDTDQDLAKRWSEVRGAIQRKNSPYLLPMSLNTKGTVEIQTDQKRIGAWLFPNNQKAGTIENFIQTLVPPQDLLWQRAEACLRSIPLQEQRFNATDFTKAHLHTWLCWQDEPPSSIGKALKAGVLDVNVPEALEFVQWIKTLFEL